MTQKELDAKISEMESYILERFKDIQSQAQSLKSIDRSRNEVAFVKMQDAFADCRRAYDSLERLMCETPEPEKEESEFTRGAALFRPQPMNRFRR